MDSYKTILTLSEGIYKEKGSKFMAFAIPIKNVDEVKEIVKGYKKQYYDARHVCFAYMIGSERNEFRINDDGEPNGTAGRPILGQINSRELTNILVIVVRYFGGILLGTGGLATAYKEATADALNHAQIIEKNVEENITLNFEYAQLNVVMKVIKESNAQILHQKFDNLCSIQLVVNKRDALLVCSILQKIDGLKIEN